MALNGWFELKTKMPRVQYAVRLSEALGHVLDERECPRRVHDVLARVGELRQVLHGAVVKLDLHPFFPRAGRGEGDLHLGEILTGGDCPLFC